MHHGMVYYVCSGGLHTLFRTNIGKLTSNVGFGYLSCRSNIENLDLCFRLLVELETQIFRDIVRKVWIRTQTPDMT